MGRVDQAARDLKRWQNRAWFKTRGNFSGFGLGKCRGDLQSSPQLHPAPRVVIFIC